MKLPASIGPYSILRELGRGNYGVVYLAQRGEGRYALKVLLGSERDAEALARFHLEGHVASKLAHPGLVGLVDAGTQDGHPYLVMEFCPGTTLRARLKQGGALPPEDAADLVCQMAEAVAAAHDAGVLHRDLKPENVILDLASGAPRITDFGLARDDRVSGITRTGEVMGTPTHMAPEQLSGHALDERVDVYALGVVLYECLTGHLPYLAADVASLAGLIQGGRPTPPSALDPHVPLVLEQICLQAMHVNPASRYLSAAALAADLRAFLDAEPLAPLPRATPVVKAIVALLVVAALLTTLVVAALWSRARAERLREQEARQQALEAAEAARRAEAELLAAEERRREEHQRQLRLAEASLESAWQAHLRHSLQSELDTLFEEAASAAAAAADPALGARVRRQRAVSDYRRGRYQRAAEALASLEGTAEEHHARFLAGMSNFRLELGQVSTEQLERAAREDPAGVWGLCAGSFLQTVVNSAPVEGERLAREALRLEPTNVDALVCLAFALNNQTRYADAWPIVERALALGPDHPRAWLAQGFVRYGLGDAEGALQGYDRLIELTEPQPMLRALRRRGHLELQLGRVQDALGDLERVLSRQPGDTQSRVLRGMVLYRLGRVDEARSEWAEAWRRDPQTTQAMAAQLKPEEAEVLQQAKP